MGRLLGVLAGLALAVAVKPASAVPTLFFDGDVAFDSGSSLLAVSAVLTGVEDISPIPNLNGSSLNFSATFDSVGSNAFFTTALFSGVAGDDLTVIDGDLNTLLVGEFTGLQAKGANDFDSGLMSGSFSVTGGVLASLFDPGSLVALQFNLSTVFGPNMFGGSFNGSIDGRLEGPAAVPEPGLLALLGIGLVLMAFTRPAAGRSSGGSRQEMK